MQSWRDLTQKIFPPKKPKIPFQSWNENYLKGLRFLVDENPEGTVDLLIQLLRLDDETVDVHLALGALFRRQGDVERAILIHQNLIARTKILPEQKIQAHVALGIDYMSAGLLDRAESVFLELLRQKKGEKECLPMLLELYQQQKDWSEAVQVAKRCARLHGDPHHYQKLMAHFYAQAAEEALSVGQDNQAQALIRQARESAPDLIRPRLLEAQLKFLTGDFSNARQQYILILEDSLNWASEVLPQLKSCYDALGESELFEAFLERLLKANPEHSGIMRYVFQFNSTLLKSLAEDVWEKNHSWVHLQALLRLTADETGSERLHQGLAILAERCSEKPAYQCIRCGLKHNERLWKCPSCRSWDTVLPVTI